MRNIFFIALVLSTVMYTTCLEDDTVINIAPCEWQAVFSPIPDTCFDLPRTPTGPYFDAPFSSETIFNNPLFNPTLEGSFYHLEYESSPNFTGLRLVRRNLCETVNSGIVTIFPGFSNKAKISNSGVLLSSIGLYTLVVFDPAIGAIDTLSSGTNVIDQFWIDDTTVGASIYDQNINAVQYYVFDLEGIIIDTLPLQYGITSNQNRLHFAHYHSTDGAIKIFNTASLELEKVLPRSSNTSRMAWIDEERLLLLESQKLSILNIETEIEETLLDYTDCENIQLNNVASDPFNHNRILLGRLDYYYDENDNFRRQQRISYYNIATGEESILELE